jgi:predicted ArsR family transcriptional regulator
MRVRHEGDATETRARVVARLRTGPATVRQLVATLGLSANAVRAQLDRLVREGVVVRRSARLGPTKPAFLYALSADAERRNSRLYVPLLTQLLHVLAGRLDAAEFDAILREAGRGLLPTPLPRGPLGERVAAATALLNRLGGLASAERSGDGYVIRSQGCPLSAATAAHAEACDAVESLLAEFIGTPVAKCCEREDRVRCCFEVRDVPNARRLEARA